MPLFHVTITNEDFKAVEEIDRDDIETAREAALKGALAIGSEHVSKGEPFFGAQITITRDGQVVEQRMVALGSSCLSM